VSFLAGIIGALIGTVAGALTTGFLARAQWNREIENARQKELRAERASRYVTLYRITRSMPRYWPQNPPRKRLTDLVEEMSDWYFAGGGLYLGERSRQRYFDVLDALPEIAAAGSPASTLTDSEVKRIALLGHELRGQLAFDLGAESYPVRAYRGREFASPSP
jgi:hypothetical protein